MPQTGLVGLQVFEAAPGSDPMRVEPPARRTRKWSRQRVAEWLVDQLGGSEKMIAGIDHAFSFPASYLDRYGLADWDAFLDDFCQHWPTCQECVEECRDNNARTGTTDEFRITDRWTQGAKSIFLFDVQGAVAKSTHAGIPWLHMLRHHDKLAGRVHFWPFDGFEVPDGVSVVAEVYPSLFRRRYPCEKFKDHERDAWLVARWLREMDVNGFLGRYFEPPLTKGELELARREGWILGVS